jgi:hypothetical protein
METSLGRRFALKTMGIGMAAGAAGIAEMGAMATITLPPEPDVHPPAGGDKTLRLTDVNGRSFSLKLVGGGRSGISGANASRGSG